jgi:hypothetical protein
MSIIIVGVGPAGFDSMELLLCGVEALSSGGVISERDNVQFIPFRQFKDNPARLAAELLAQVPGQVETYAVLHGFGTG